MRFLKLSSAEQTVDILGSQGMGEASPGRADDPQVGVNESPPPLPGSRRYRVASEHRIDGRWQTSQECAAAGGHRPRTTLTATAGPDHPSREL